MSVGMLLPNTDTCCFFNKSRWKKVCVNLKPTDDNLSSYLRSCDAVVPSLPVHVFSEAVFKSKSQGETLNRTVSWISPLWMLEIKLIVDRLIHWHILQYASVFWISHQKLYVKELHLNKYYFAVSTSVNLGGKITFRCKYKSFFGISHHSAAIKIVYSSQ